ncbi:hypothetical protein FPQ18DRAFT_308568 [Pyronema domesticum]|nr:hypothetical protein FPQ18DRAFT_308568 [Pyronema domesticum]
MQKSNKAMPFGAMAGAVVDDFETVIWQDRTLLRTLRAWFPVFFWLLDTTLIDVFLIAHQHFRGPKGSLYTTQREFQNVVAWGLIEEGFAVLEDERKEAPKARQMAREEADNTAMLVEESLDSVHRGTEICNTTGDSHLPEPAEGKFRKGHKRQGNSCGSSSRLLNSLVPLRRNNSLKIPMALEAVA